MSETGLAAFDTTEITGGELADIKHALPAEVREVWPARQP